MLARLRQLKLILPIRLGERLFVGTAEGGLWSTADGGQTLQNISGHWPSRTYDCRGDMRRVALPDRHVRDISSAQTVDGSAALYVSTAARAVYVSVDSGETWELRSTGLSCNDQADIDAFGVPHFRDLALGGGQTNDLYVAGFDGLFRSSDSGHHWVQLETLPISLVRGLTVSSADGENHAVAITTYGAVLTFRLMLARLGTLLIMDWRQRDCQILNSRRTFGKTKKYTAHRWDDY